MKAFLATLFLITSLVSNDKSVVREVTKQPEDFRSQVPTLYSLFSEGYEEVADTINREDRIVFPERMYRGDYFSIASQLGTNTVSDEEWIKYFRPDGPKKSRSGMYVTSTTEGNLYMFSGPNHRGFVEVKIKDECRQPNRVISLYRANKNARFIEWAEKQEYQSHFKNKEDFSKQCGLNTPYQEHWDAMVAIQQGKKPGCTVLLEKAYHDLDIAMVYDAIHNWRDAALIIKAGCVKSYTSYAYKFDAYGNLLDSTKNPDVFLEELTQNVATWYNVINDPTAWYHAVLVKSLVENILYLDIQVCPELQAKTMDLVEQSDFGIHPKENPDGTVTYVDMKTPLIDKIKKFKTKKSCPSAGSFYSTQCSSSTHPF